MEMSLHTECANKIPVFFALLGQEFLCALCTVHWQWLYVLVSVSMPGRRWWVYVHRQWRTRLVRQQENSRTVVWPDTHQDEPVTHTQPVTHTHTHRQTYRQRHRQSHTDRQT